MAQKRAKPRDTTIPRSIGGRETPGTSTFSQPPLRGHQRQQSDSFQPHHIEGPLLEKQTGDPTSSKRAAEITELPSVDRQPPVTQLDTRLDDTRRFT